MCGSGNLTSGQPIRSWRYQSSAPRCKWPLVCSKPEKSFRIKSQRNVPLFSEFLGAATFLGSEFFCLKLWSHCWPRQSPVILPRRRSYCVALEQWLWFYFAAANSNIGFWRRNEVSDEPHVFEQYCHSFKGISVFFLGIVEISTAK